MKTSASTKKRSKSSRAKESQPQLRDFGVFLRQARLAKHTDKGEPWTQQHAADKLQGSTQSFIAQLESGRITNPPPSLLQLLATCYLGAVHPDGFPVNLSSIQAELFRDKYGLSAAKAELLRREIKKVDDLANWEKSLEDLKELWIVAPNFVDQDNNQILQAVISQLKLGAIIVYFVDQNDISHGGRFDNFITLLKMHPNLQAGVPGQVWWYGITREEKRFFTCSYVIANPLTAFGLRTSPRADGYTILPHGNEPYFGIQTDEKSLKSQVSALVEAMCSKTEGKGSKKDREWTREVLDPTCDRPDSLCFGKKGRRDH